MKKENAMFPTNTSSSLGFIKLIEQEEKLSLKERMSYRLVRAAAHIPHGDFLGWQMTLPQEGKVDMHLFGSGDIKAGDLEWFAENIAKPGSTDTEIAAPQWSENDTLYELRIAPTYTFEKKAVGFGATLSSGEPSGIVYPVSFFSEMPELVKALRQIGTTIRYCVQRASDAQIATCRDEVLKAIGGNNANEYADYIGSPVCVRTLVRTSEPLSLRALSIFDNKSSGLSVRKLGNMSEYYCEMCETL